MLLARNWWMFLIRGILALIFGVVAIFFPQTAFLSLVIVFGAFMLVDGVFAIISAFSSKAEIENWWWLILGGVLGIVIGLLTLFRPMAAGQAWLILISVWAVVTGIFEIITAIRLRKVIEGELWMILSGIASIAFGILIAIYPQSGAFAIGLIIGIYAIMFGAMMIALAFGLRKHSATEPSTAG